MINGLTTDEEQVIEKIRLVKKSGYGEVSAQIQKGQVVYTKYSIGEQIKMELVNEQTH